MEILETMNAEVMWTPCRSIDLEEIYDFTVYVVQKRIYPVCPTECGTPNADILTSNEIIHPQLQIFLFNSF